ncbi:MAG: O-methyltransferase [Eubacterium sp.]|uniref:O-methyltransferase n=1 Tax=Eubacterium sp. F2 TaxID=3381348 RepID=UPI0039082FE1|nr:O-methyltransferase [Eubacterium sp.]MCI2196633.1 O-methyltransferase [Eubacterium sp.]
MEIEITSPLVEDFLHQHYRPLNSSLEKLREISRADKVPLIRRETEMLLSTLLELKQPRKILEIGTAIGYSAVYFATFCPHAEVYTIEKDEYMFRAARINVRQSRLENQIHVLHGDGAEMIDLLKANGIKDFDMVFIDAAKSKYGEFMDHALTVCRDGAMIVCDDILQNGLTLIDADMDPKRERKHRTNIRQMREFISKIMDDPRLSTSLNAVGDGMSVSIYHGDEE